MTQRRSRFSVPLMRELMAVQTVKRVFVFLIGHLFSSALVIADDEGEGLQEDVGLDKQLISDTQGDPS